MFDSNRNELNSSNRIRPVVTIPANTKITESETGSDITGEPHHIESY